MLDPDVQEIGVGVARSIKTGRYYAVQDFGRPHSAAISFKIHNTSDVPIKYDIDGQSLSVQPGYTITYERCRPPELRFQWPADATVTPDAKESVPPHFRRQTPYVRQIRDSAWLAISDRNQRPEKRIIVRSRVMPCSLQEMAMRGSIQEKRPLAKRIYPNG
jgi:hypothetical protein